MIINRHVPLLADGITMYNLITLQPWVYDYCPAAILTAHPTSTEGLSAAKCHDLDNDLPDNRFQNDVDCHPFKQNTINPFA